jgi:hypothetical protein
MAMRKNTSLRRATKSASPFCSAARRSARLSVRTSGGVVTSLPSASAASDALRPALAVVPASHVNGLPMVLVILASLFGARKPKVRRRAVTVS